ncbi:integrator complex subunit 7 [Brevipalpus obovatus]|uniref:integrator complex subunit 7 n=1 Tax=Brevipalpus obovatus TaxID=246614 RepID=UPI003D9E7525
MMETENNLDANALLSELDRGLRSGKMGEECESIVGFPWLFTRYPFPILINSASLKLADLFRSNFATNFSRLLILRVIQESEKHLDKIINLDEFVRRLFSVTYSNDPIARSTTLRVLGSVSCIIAERKNIHHIIRTSLDAEDEVEASAAIEAAAAFAEQSIDFALTIYPKVLKMASNRESSIEMRVRLLSILHHPYYNVKVATDVRRACIHLLEGKNSDKFIQAILHTLTHIATSSLFFLSDHVTFLIEYIQKTKRRSLVNVALKELQSVSSGSPHLWSKQNVHDLLTTVEPLFATGATSIIVPIFINLVKCPCLLTSDPLFVEKFHQDLEEICLNVLLRINRGKLKTSESKRLEMIAFSFQLLATLSQNSDSIKVKTVRLLEDFLMSFHSSKRDEDDLDHDRRRSYKTICISLVTLCNSDEEVANRMINSLEQLLFSQQLSLTWTGYVCEIFCALTHSNTSPQFLTRLSELIIQMNQNEACDENSLAKLCVLSFQTATRRNIKCPFDFITHIKSRSYWFFFKLTRQAMRYGHYHVSQEFCGVLQNAASSEAIHFWILSLNKISIAENLLINSKNSIEISTNLMSAITLYSQALSSLKAAGVGSNCLVFAGEYVRLRCKLLRAHSMLRQSCNLVRTSPAPAIAVSSALNSRDDLMRCGAIVPQMRKCAKEFRNVAEAYSALYQTSFNADNETLSHLQLLQHSCTIVAEAIESVFQTNKTSSLFVSKDTHLESDRYKCKLGTSIEHQKLNSVCHEVSEIVRSCLNDPRNSSVATTSSIPTQTSTPVLDGKQIATLLTVSIKLLLVPLCIPRLFFQSLQSICIKLALSPLPKSQGDVIVTKNSEAFALKVEGVVVYEQSTRVLRKVSKVMLSVNGCLANKVAPGASSTATYYDLQAGKSQLDGSISLQSTVAPHNDYFHEQFLLSLVTVGVYNISVEASIIDENDAQWKTGPVVSISTKVVEDPTGK